jgi:acetylornithine deacetylase/succinyl-diaminopimelate desuccinylase-like protein
MFSYITAIRALKSQNIPHCRLVITIEACEESGSVDLDFYVRRFFILTLSMTTDGG